VHAFRNFLDEYVDRVEPLQREAHLAYWTASLSGRSEDFARYAELELAYGRLHADPRAFAELERWRGRGGVTDPLERQQLEIVYRSHLRNQIADDLMEAITRLSSAIVARFNVFRARVDGDELTGNAVREILHTSKDPRRRRAAWEADKAVGAEVRDDLLELVRLRNRAARSVGFEDYYMMSLALGEQEPGDVAGVFDRLETLTRGPFARLKAELDEALAANCGVERVDLRPWHYNDPFFQEAPRPADLDLDHFYHDHDVVALVRDFFAGIGLDVDPILARSDLFERPGKEQHAYCIDVDRRGDVRVLANVRNDEHWAGTMLHELGHAVYDRHLEASLPFVLREPAHVFVTEAIAMLFGRLSKDTAWIHAMTGHGRAAEGDVERAARLHQRRHQLVFSRWCQVMTRFERALYRAPQADLDALWWELVARYQMVTPPEGRRAPDWAAKIHVVSAPVYYHNYQLGELLASQLDHTIQARVGRGGARKSYVGRKGVGAYLRESVFAHGRRYRWDELVARATGAPLDPLHFVEQYVAGDGQPS
jgi:peptidyl-dipeptidase A